MGAWSTSIFSDDLAADVRDEFRELISEGLDPDEATKQLLKKYRSSLRDGDERPVFWLALAATQWNLGRLVPGTLAEALNVIDSGEDLKRWQENGKLLQKRRDVLVKLREKLVSPLPPPKKLAPPF